MYFSQFIDNFVCDVEQNKLKFEKQQKKKND